ncbi:MAG TPA: hypothetical protein VKL19_04365 [Thermoanaerobaculia bacterium]|nr:hypothetical protein [Thermoanaerobaculia bacterium]
MNSTLATEPTEKPATPSLLETWGKNERMRHVPPLEWMTEKLDRDLRRRIEKLCASAAASPSTEPVETELRALGRSIDRLADTAKYTRGSNHAPADIAARIDAAITHAISCLGSLDASLLGRRYPYQTLERSKAEPIYGAFLVVIEHVHRLTKLIRAVDSRIDERLLEGLVTLQEPLREQAIA